MNKRYMIAEVIFKAGRQPSFEFRDREKQHSAMITLVCGLVIVLAVAFAFCCRGCSPDPVGAYSMCEQCGEVIGGSDHGRCNPAELAKLETGNLKLGGRTCE
jgi:hypothetical protein